MITLAFRKFYKDIDSLDIKPLEAHARNIEKCQDTVRRVSARHVLRIGKELVEARERLGKHGNGKFGKWYAERLKLSKRTVYNYINAYEVFEDCATVAPMFDVTAMYFLATPGMPRKVITEALIHAEDGRRITLQWAKMIVEHMHPEWKDSGGKQQERERRRQRQKKERMPEPEDGQPEDEGGEEFEPDSKRLARLKMLYDATDAKDRRMFRKWLEERGEKYKYKKYQDGKRKVEFGDKGAELNYRKGEFRPKFDKDGRRLDRKKTG